VLVASWINETQAKRAAAEARLKKPARRRRMTEEEIMTLVAEIGAIMEALKDADPADKADLYSRLQVTLTYHPNEKRVAAEARPASVMYVGACPRGDLNPGTGEISLNLGLNSKTGEKSRIGGLMRLSLHPPTAVVTDPGTGNRSAAPSRASGRRATSSDHHPDSGDAISAVLSGCWLRFRDTIRRADYGIMR
jgi:hypothetical protein